MNITTSAAAPHEQAVDLLVLGVFADELKSHAVLKRFDKTFQRSLLDAAAEQEFSGKSKQQFVLHTLGKVRPHRVALVGLGARKKLTSAVWLRLGGTGVRLGNGCSAAQVAIAATADDGGKAGKSQAHDAPAWVGLVARGAHLGRYRFNKYRSDKGRTPSVQKLVVHAPALGTTGSHVLSRAAIISDAVCLTRDLVNTPAADLYPASFASRATALCKTAKLKCQVLEPTALRKKNMNLLLAVGQGSAHTPRLVHVTHSPPKAQGCIVLVGKGVTFDSGGLDLKTPEGMLGMKVDMGGAATVLATMMAVAKLKLPLQVHGLMSLAENMPSGTSFRPGDVLTHATGKTVEINNTDAEGRLVLADALHHGLGLKPDHMIDLATLTGACMVALGPVTMGLFSNDDALATGLNQAAGRAGEDLWRMPLTPALRDQLKSDIADMRNTGERYGGAITAALFLQEFVADTSWAHLDIAGPVTTTEEAGHMCKGATGVAVATLIEWLESLVGQRGRR